mmetsp:Transcript_5595/g.21128  ORF Transcript_5595/g.21128 Transcript_5595/m.21128 type:complete len:251 (-) Transcript_5595:46-798(-)
MDGHAIQELAQGAVGPSDELEAWILLLESAAPGFGGHIQVEGNDAALAAEALEEPLAHAAPAEGAVHVSPVVEPRVRGRLKFILEHHRHGRLQQHRLVPSVLALIQGGLMSLLHLLAAAPQLLLQRLPAAAVDLRLSRGRAAASAIGEGEGADKLVLLFIQGQQRIQDPSTSSDEPRPEGRRQERRAGGYSGPQSRRERQRPVVQPLQKSAAPTERSAEAGQRGKSAPVAAPAPESKRAQKPTPRTYGRG